MNGYSIAIQAKGYEASVGNEAVQQAYAGMSYYRCDSCMVITNSYFTSSAEQLAGKIACRLIDGLRIPDLIAGKYEMPFAHLNQQAPAMPVATHG